MQMHILTPGWMNSTGLVFDTEMGGENMERKLIPEMFALRSIACLCLVFRNSTNRAFPESSFLGNFFELLLTFG
ncbi:MAG: hypothetical protein K0R28_1683, partial [Paenibacillus sp.]|nr:hypothetical protein [Paenibacillus sp.]